MKTMKTLNVEKALAAIESDAGQTLPGLRESLLEAKAGVTAHVHTPAEMARRRGRPVGSVAAVTKQPVKLRLDADVLEALRATGDGWQTRINDMLRASLALGGRLPDPDA
ncbi:BrnA antitoxin family protein [Roseateles amylovorans]|uniref:BrnA antitoxin family protein n=1 Tax=Roseateles amylovorans TaxID=2978473 RepID=A0ABY6B2D9_9BURK|nr:BrnA antitoxin family protein [Roseateles amylovorans]UXH79558.1 BrnA antitoxin family protein [Roseateles amylovorans]